MNLKNFYVLITLEKAFKLWRESGKRNQTFGAYCDVLKFMGYLIL